MSELEKDEAEIITSPSKASPPPLVGVESLMVKGLAYLQRAFVTPQSKPLLVTGLKGSGKTSFARHLGEIMGCDRSFLTGVYCRLVRAYCAEHSAEIIYEDVTKLDAEDRSRDVRKKMSEWVEDAKKRRPCLLIIDGLDSVLHPESEVGRYLRCRECPVSQPLACNLRQPLFTCRPSCPTVCRWFYTDWHARVGDCQPP